MWIRYESATETTLRTDMQPRPLSRTHSVSSSKPPEAEKTEATAKKTHSLSWKDPSLAVKGQNRANRLQVFTQAFDFVQEALHTNLHTKEEAKAISPEQKRKYERWAAELQRAKTDENVEFPTEDFIKETAEMATQLGKGEKAANPTAMWYGGTTGNKIFQATNSNYIEPMLKSAIESYCAETSNLSYEEQLDATKSFLNCMLDLAGNGRNMIARITSSDNADEIGARRSPHEHSHMQDKCESSSYDPWRAAVKGRISSLVASHPAVREALAQGKSLRQLVDEQGTKIAGVSSFQFTADGHTVELSIDHTVSPPKCIGAFYGAPVNLEAARYEFEWSQEESGSLVTTELWCHHPTLEFNNIVETGAAEIRAIALWDGRDKDALLDNVTSFMYKMANSSAFLRGQQAVTEKFLDAVLSTKGLKMTFSKEWDKPNPTYDQHALQMIHKQGRQEFMEAARKNIQLVPRG